MFWLLCSNRMDPHSTLVGKVKTDDATFLRFSGKSRVAPQMVKGDLREQRKQTSWSLYGQDVG